MYNTAFYKAMMAIMVENDPEQKNRLTNALKDSLGILQTDGITLSPIHIAEKYNLEIQTLIQNYIVIDILDAYYLVERYSDVQDFMESVEEAFSEDKYFRTFKRPITQYGNDIYLTYKELFSLCETSVPEEFYFKEVSGDFLPQLNVFVDPGSAPRERIEQFLDRISALYKATGGSGINFKLNNIFGFSKETV